MDSKELESIFKDFGNLVVSKPDFYNLINSKEFKLASIADHRFLKTVMRNREMTVRGDVRTVNITRFGAISISITIDNKFNGLTSSTEVRVDVPDSLYNEVISSIRPDTGVILNVIYKKLDVIVDTFELVSIVESNMDLNFPYYVCEGLDTESICYYILAYRDTECNSHCPMCGSRTRRINNVYTDEFKNYIKLNSIYQGE